MDEQNSNNQITDATIIGDDTSETTSETGAPETPGTDALGHGNAGKIKIAIGIVLVGVLVAGGMFYLRSQSDTVAAVVNGTKIKKIDFDNNVALITQQASLQGYDVTSPDIQKEITTQAIDTLVNNALLLEAAGDADITASDEEIKVQRDALVLELKGEENLKAQMDVVGLTEEKLRSNIYERIVVDKFIEAETDIELLAATPEEIGAFYAMLSEQGGTTTPPLDTIRSEIEREIITPKRLELVNAFLATLREGADIEIKIETGSETSL